MATPIIIERNSWEKFETLTGMVHTEIAALGYAKFQADEKGRPYVYVSELFVIPQEVSAAEVDFVSDGLPYAIMKATDEGRLDDLRFCIHSHVNMSAYFSGTDDEMIETFGKAGVPWLASVVLNKKGETDARVDVFGVTNIPGTGQVTLDAEAVVPPNGELHDQCKAEIDKFVKRSKPKWDKSHKPSEGVRVQNGEHTYYYSSYGNQAWNDGTDAPLALPPAKDMDEHTWDYCDCVSQQEAYLMIELSQSQDWQYILAGGTYWLFDQHGDYTGSIPATLLADPQEIEALIDEVPQKDRQGLVIVSDKHPTGDAND